MKYPDVWGKGIIFAFSGLEGETNFENSLIATTASEPGKFVLRVENGINFCFKNLHLCKKINPLIISSDVFVTENPNLSLVFVQKDIISGHFSDPFIPFLENSTQNRKKDILVSQIDTKSGSIALAVDEKRKKFSIAYDRKNRNDAVKKAIRQLSECYIGKQIRKKINFFENISLPQFKTEKEEKTYLKALSIMKVNCESPYGKITYLWTTPDRWPHRYLWFWDSAFHTFGNKFISVKLAESTLFAVLSCQRKDGFISITMSPDKGRLYEELTQPPLFAWAGLELFNKTKNYQFLEILYIAISKYMKWLFNSRDRDKDGLLEWITNDSPASKCGECGMDNSPRFDTIKKNEPVAAIDLNCFAINEMECLSKIAAILDKSEESRIWKKLSFQKKKMVDTFLYDEKEDFYYDRRPNGDFVRVKTPASFLPLFAGVASPERAKKLVEKLQNKNLFWTELPLPSVAINEKSFSKDMWRGGTWLNYNFLIYRGLVRYGYNKISGQLIKKTKKAVEDWYIKTGSIFEFYDPDNKIPPEQLPRKDWLGKRGWTKTIADYHWSAAVYVAILNELRSNND